MKFENLSFDVVVCGGGMGGVCAALSAARLGNKVALVQNRPVLGGNASSEVRVHIGGAPEHGYHYDARESGIIEEIRLETAVRDPFNEYFWIDQVLFSFCREESNLSLFLNTHISHVELEQNARNDSKIIKYVEGFQQGTEKKFRFDGKIFVDSTGDAMIADLAGAQYRMGREGKDEFNEMNAPDKPDNFRLGSTIMFSARDLGHPVKFDPPKWALKFTKEDFKHRSGLGKSNNFEHYWHSDTAGWWWVEYGGILDTISDNEEIKTHLQAIIYGIWDYIKNKNPKTIKQAENFEITWVSQIPGKRESRRVIGDYILKESDLLSMKIFDDQIAVGGWSIDLHPPKGFYASTPGAEHTSMDLPYSIPYRSIYSKNVKNLFIACRAISATHVAHGSTRLIATIACIGQAAGTAAHLCVKKKCLPKDLVNNIADNNRIEELQQLLLREDQFLLGIKNNDTKDLALNATITCTSEKKCSFGDESNIDKFIPLYISLAQRFYVSEYIDENNSNCQGLSLYIKNDNNFEIELEGGIRFDKDRFEFASNNDICKINAVVPPKYLGWIEFNYTSADKELINSENVIKPFNSAGNYWIYLNAVEKDEVYWGKQEKMHWNGFRLGYFDEEVEKWKTSRINGSPFFDGVVGFFGTMGFKIENTGSPFPSSMINNGLNRPFYTPNVWISEKISARKKQNKSIEIKIEFAEKQTFNEIWFTFDTELNNSYPHQSYGKERIKDWPILGKAPKCISDLDIFILNQNGIREKIGEIRGNYQRRVKYRLEHTISAESLIVVPLKNWGFDYFNIYEIRIYHN